MKKIQSLLQNFENLRIEIYSTHLVVYNTETCDEESFNTKKEVINHLKYLLS